MTRISAILIFIFVASALWAGPTNMKIAIIKKRDLKEYNSVIEGFKSILSEKAYKVDVREFLFHVPELVKGLKEFKPDLIFTLGTSVTRSISSEFLDTPVLFAMVVDPVSSGIEGENVTGVSLDIPLKEQFRVIKMVLPSAVTGGVFYTKDENHQNIVEARQEALKSGINLKHYPLPEGGVLSFDNKNVDFFWIIPDTKVCRGTVIRRMLLSGLKSMVPVVGISPRYAKAGALMALACNYEDIGFQVGEMVVEIVEGKEVKELKIRKPRRVEYFINIAVASRLKIRLPEGVIEGASGVFGK